MHYRTLECALVAALIAGISGCGTVSKWATKKGTPAEEVSLPAVPEPARIAIEKLVAGGKIKKIEKEEVDGKVLYEVEATVGEKDVAYDVAGDGTVLMTEDSVPYATLPAPVRAAAEKYFGSAAGLRASREVGNAKTLYEVEGTKKGNAVTLKLTDVGRIVEEEKE